MTYAKTTEFDIEFQNIANYAKALSHPARVAILDYLASQNTCVSGDISDKIPLSRTTVSQHLQELKKAGLIKGTISGTRIYYCLENKNINEILSKLTDFTQKLNGNQAACSI